MRTCWHRGFVVCLKPISFNLLLRPDGCTIHQPFLKMPPRREIKRSFAPERGFLPYTSAGASFFETKIVTRTDVSSYICKILQVTLWHRYTYDSVSRSTNKFKASRHRWSISKTSFRDNFSTAESNIPINQNTFPSLEHILLPIKR